jgi:intracellular sulfur oxidation DsrE/DsrF family protein
MKPFAVVVGLLSAALLSGCGTVGLTDKKEQAANALRNIVNHLEVKPKAKIVVVTHAQGVAEITRLQQREGYAYLRP